MSDTQDRIEKLRRLDVDVDALLEAAVSLAEFRRDIRAKATVTPLPGNLSRILIVPDVDEEEADPVALLETAARMVRHGQEPALALYIAATSSCFLKPQDGPARSVAQLPVQLFAPTCAAHVLKLLSLVGSPMPPRYLGEGETLRPAIDHRLPKLPAGLEGHTAAIAKRWADAFEDPQLMHDWLIGNAEKAFAPPRVHVDLDDVPIGVAVPPLPPPAETPEDTALREAARAEAVATAVLTLRHAALEALRLIGNAFLSFRPRKDLHPFFLNLAAEAFPKMKRSKRNQAIASVYGVDEKTVRRKLDTPPRPRVRKGGSTVSPTGAGSAKRPDRKKGRTNADRQPPETQPPPPEVRRAPVRVPAGRPPARASSPFRILPPYPGGMPRLRLAAAQLKLALDHETVRRDVDHVQMHVAEAAVLANDFVVDRMPRRSAQIGNC